MLSDLLILVKKKSEKVISRFSKLRFAFFTLGLLILASVVSSVFLSQRKTQGPQGQQSFGQKPGGAQDFGGSPSTTIRPRWSGPIPDPPKEKTIHYKGLWGPTWIYPEEYSDWKSTPEQYTSWGVNIINIVPGFEINAKGEVRYPLDFPTYEDMDARIGELATEFYKNNVHLAITLQIHYKEEFIQNTEWGGETAYIPREKIQEPGYLKNFDKIVVDMAKIAQKYQVEVFSPLGEPENVFYDGKLASEWSQQILPKIKKYYKGKIYYKGDLHKNQGEAMNFKGYDILGMVTSPVDPNASLEEARKTYVSDIERVLAWSKRDNIPTVVISEYGYLGNNQMESAARIGVVLEESSKKLNGVFLTEPLPNVLKTTQGKQIVAQMKRWFLP